MKPTYEQLQLALKLALQLLEPLEPGDSRAVSDEFVALASVHSEFVNDDVMAVIVKAIKS